MRATVNTWSPYLRGRAVSHGHGGMGRHSWYLKSARPTVRTTALVVYVLTGVQTRRTERRSSSRCPRSTRSTPRARGEQRPRATGWCTAGERTARRDHRVPASEEIAGAWNTGNAPLCCCLCQKRSRPRQRERLCCGNKLAHAFYLSNVAAGQVPGPYGVPRAEPCGRQPGAHIRRSQFVKKDRNCTTSERGKLKARYAALEFPSLI